ncbi:MAG: diaminopimelate decarboxylase [Eggerthellaceae bacterium]|nr:diaminopimelate decarboxylase [Eggerthellaceae bacterium]
MTGFPASNITINAAGHIAFAGQDTVELAARFGTPVYLMDEDRIRANCRAYRDAFAAAFGRGSAEDCCMGGKPGPDAGFEVLFASKAASYVRLYQIMTEENMGVDVVSSGEIATAKAAGFDMSRAYFHGNNKTDADIAYGLDAGVGTFVVDGEEELAALEAACAGRGVRQDILLRITPGIDPHTYEEVATGKVDSKFGSAIATGAAEAITAAALACPHLRLKGYHCHVGSQVFGEDVFERAARVMLEFAAHIRDVYGFAPEELNLGGGFGVPYVAGEEPLDIAAKVAALAHAVKAACADFDLDVPRILMEPGRSIVADAGMTLYTVGSVKRIPGYKNYVSVDGGLPDNPRYALYRSRYTVLAASRAGEACDMEATVAGRCCESGVIIQPGVMLPASMARGDILAVCTTGAYNYSMASNYNRIPRPPVVMLSGGEGGAATVAVERETFEDIIRLDVR